MTNAAGPPAIERPQNFQIVRLPADLAPAGIEEPFALLCGRTDPTTTRVDVYFRRDDSGDAFQRLAGVSQFAVAGVLDASAATGATTIDIEIDAETPAADFDSVNIAQTADEVADDNLLLIVCRGDFPTAFEVMAVSGISALGGGVYQVTVERARRGTLAGGDGAHTWAAGERAFLIYREQLQSWTHARLASLLAAADDATFRLVPTSAWRSADVDDVYDAGTNHSGLTTETTVTFSQPGGFSAGFSSGFQTTAVT